MPKQTIKDLPFIKISDLEDCVRKVISAVKKKEAKAEENDLFANAIDPFSALFDTKIQGITVAEWFKQERRRQNQKTLQNALGNFHQDVIGCMPGWKNLGVGKVIDLSNAKLKIIAEVKNKYNTTKGNHKTAIYDDLKEKLSEKGIGYTAYYVEMIPQNKKSYDKAFEPSDNRTSKRREIDERIRRIDGKSFYQKITGDKDALEKIYHLLPNIIDKFVLSGKDEYPELVRDGSYKDLFDKIY